MKAPELRPGDYIGIVSPSWGGAAALPHRVEKGVAQLKSLGFKVKFGRHALNERGFVSDTAENRAADLHEMFRDPEVRLILASIGGDHSCHLLPLLDFDLIRQHPKPLMGYSDITVLNIAIWKETGLVTFNGPALLTDLAEYPQMLDYTKAWFLKSLCDPSPIGPIEPSEWWTEEFLDWSQKKDLERSRNQNRSEGWSWLKSGVAEGVLVGGCLESLQHLRGTRYWPDWDGAILFFETSEEAPSPATVDGILMDYENMDVLARLRGMLVGRPMGYSRQQRDQFREVILERTRRYAFPIIADMDFGHTAPQFILPIGCRARIDCARRRFEILESAVTAAGAFALSSIAPSSRKRRFTDKQGQYLAFIHYYMRVHRRAPAEADMQRYFQVTPPSVHQMVMTLDRLGLIARIPWEARSIRVLLPEEEIPELR